MLSRLSAIAGVAVLVWTGAAWALGLGPIEAKSRLNQPLVAVIPISSSTPAELDSLVVQLASNEDFERAGLERPEFLSSLRLEIDGKNINVRSKDIVRDPFVTLLLDLRWTGGHLLREYTLLLDPPGLAQAPQPDQPDQPAMAEPGSAKATQPSAPSAMPAKPAPATTKPRSAEAPATAPRPAPAPAPAGGAPDRYGPVAPQETLWSIAYKLRPDPDSITMDQMQVALLNANPQAFKDGQLSQLLKGSVLTIPDVAEIRAVDPVASKAMVAASRGYTPAPVAVAPAPTPKPAAPAPTPKPAPTPAPAPVEPAPPPVAKAEPPPPPAPKPAPKVEAQPKPAPEPAPAPEPKVADATKTAPAPEPAAPPPSEPKPEVAAKPAPVAPEPPATDVAGTTPDEPVEAEPAEPKPKPKPVTPRKVEAPSLLDGVLGGVQGVLDSPLAIPGAALVLLILGGVLGYGKLKDRIAKWSYDREAKKMAAGRESSDKTEMDETEVEAVDDQAPTVMNAGPDGTAEIPASEFGETQAMEAAKPASAESTMQQTVKQEPEASASGARPVDFDVTGQYASETVQINLDAGDPVSEAEFHRAYGLYDEAALLLKQALEKDPKRIDAKVKLAEIYFEASKSKEFVATATELKKQLPADEWSKIALMGSQLAPDEALFSDAGAGGAGAVDLSFDEPAAAEPAPAPKPAAKPAPKPAPPKEKKPAPEPEKPAEDSGMLDFKLDDALGAAAPAAAPAAAAEAPPKDDGNSLEFDLEGLSLDAPGDASAASPETAALEQAAEPAAESAADLDLGDFDIGEPSLPEGGDAPADAGEGDDVSTKLDLARAYVDMGDNDMAKGLLNEVMQSGSAQQKKEAEELLQRVQA